MNSIWSVLKIAALGLFSLLIAGNAYLLPPVLGHGEVDQNSNIKISDFSYNLQYNKSVSQSFTPTANSISGIDLSLSNYYPIFYSPQLGGLSPEQSQAQENTFIMKILDPTGLALITQTYSVSYPSYQGYLHFDFESVDLNPGDKYTIQLSSTGTSGYIAWHDDPNNPYPGGSGAQPEEDFGFRTYFVESTGHSANSPPKAVDKDVYVNSGNQIEITLVAYDAQLDKLTYEVTRQPSDGHLDIISEDGRIVTYTPNTEFIGQDSFTFQARDGSSSSNNATVRITILNSPAILKLQITHASLEDPSDEETQNYVGGGIVSIAENRNVTFDASKSRDNDAKMLKFSWKQTEGPIVDIRNSKESIITFVTPAIGHQTDLVFQLTIDDGFGGLSIFDVSIRISDNNRPPTANAGADMEVNPGDVVRLDGSASSDPDHDPLTYSWALLSVGSLLDIIDIQNAETANPSFIFPMNDNTTLTIQLQVRDRSGAIGTDTVSITDATNLPPIANAGADVSASSNQAVKLDGSASSDPDHDPLTYSWALVTSRSDLDSVDIRDSNSSTPSIVMPDVKNNTALTFQLKVTDSNGASDTDTVTVILQPAVDFVITVTPQSGVISRGEFVEFEVGVVQTSGENIPISINVKAPEDVQGKLSVQYDNEPALAPFKRVVRIGAADNLDEQQYSIVITAAHNSIEKLAERTVEYPLTVKTKEGGGGWNVGIIGALLGVPIAGLVMLSHFILPKPVSQPSTLAAKGHTFGLQIEVQLDDTGSSIPGAGGLGSISNFSEGAASDTIKNSFNQVLMQDTGETFEQFKQLKVVKGWLKKRMGGIQAGEQSVATPPDPNAAGNIGVELKKIIAENLGKVSTPELVRMVKQAVISEAVTRLQKGIESAAIPVPPVKASILFIPVIDGVPVRINMLRVPFEIDPIVELKGAKTVVTGDVKSFFAEFVDLRMKLYYLMPMMLGTKKIRFTDKTVHVAKDLTVKVNKDSAI